MGRVSWRETLEKTNDSETQRKFATFFFLDRETFQICRKHGVPCHFAKENDRNILQTTDLLLDHNSHSASLPPTIKQTHQQRKPLKQKQETGITRYHLTSPPRKRDSTHCHSFPPSKKRFNTLPFLPTKIRETSQLPNHRHLTAKRI